MSAGDWVYASDGNIAYSSIDGNMIYAIHAFSSVAVGGISRWKKEGGSDVSFAAALSAMQGASAVNDYSFGAWDTYWTPYTPDWICRSQLMVFDTSSANGITLNSVKIDVVGLYDEFAGMSAKLCLIPDSSIITDGSWAWWTGGTDTAAFTATGTHVLALDSSVTLDDYLMITFRFDPYTDLSAGGSGRGVVYVPAPEASHIWFRVT